MQCTLLINKEVISYDESVAYKYVIHSPNRKDAHPYEFLHHLHGVFDRALKVPKEIKSEHILAANFVLFD